MVSRSSTRLNEDSIFSLQKKLLSAITVSQRSRLWSNLPEREKSKIITHIVGDEIVAVEFWNTLNHDKRCELVDQLSEE
jgi:Mg/Co/Ni transporter MgtE